ncbi:hypothetical protein HWV62_32567 [Athelia sp. TMB]|nr:hypothetical protein HWV62_32567 [Athelia sp. TMB]
MRHRRLTLERNTLWNIDAPLAMLPDELLCDIFGMAQVGHAYSSRRPVAKFALNVCGVCRRWRAIAVSLHTLWAYIRYAGGPRKEIIDLHIERSGKQPLHITICNTFPVHPDILKLLGAQMPRCRALDIARVPPFDGLLATVVRNLSLRHSPKLARLRVSNMNSNLWTMPLFRRGPPTLRVVSIGNLETRDVRFCLPSLLLVTHLRLERLNIASEEQYSCLATLLGGLTSLTHLELQPTFQAVQEYAPRPMLLSRLRFLHFDCEDQVWMINSIEGPLLSTVSLAAWMSGGGLSYQSELAHVPRRNFPRLEHLILQESTEHLICDMEWLCGSFQSAAHLTWETWDQDGQGPVETAVEAVLDAAGSGRWDGLESIAVFEVDYPDSWEGGTRTAGDVSEAVRHSGIGPLRRDTPFDLAYEIFLMACGCPDHDEKTLMSMLLVCKQWKSCLFSMPRIWHNLVRARRDVCPSTFLTRLARTGSTPLCLQFRIRSDYEDEDEISNFVPILEMLAPRWQSIHVTCDHISPVMSLLRFTQSLQMPLLKKLEIDDYPGIVTLAQPQGLLAQTPALATLYIPSAHFIHFPRPETLTTIIFTPCYVNMELLQMLSLSHVRTLHMIGCLWGNLLLRAPYEFNQLRQLQIEPVPMDSLDLILSIISAPLLHTLVARVALYPGNFLLSLAESLNFKPHMPSLTHLHLDIDPSNTSDSYLAAMLRRFISCDTRMNNHPLMLRQIVQGRIAVEHPLDSIGFDTRLLGADAVGELMNFVTLPSFNNAIRIRHLSPKNCGRFHARPFDHMAIQSPSNYKATYARFYLTRPPMSSLLVSTPLALRTVNSPAECTVYTISGIDVIVTFAHAPEVCDAVCARNESEGQVVGLYLEVINDAFDLVVISFTDEILITRELSPAIIALLSNHKVLKVGSGIQGRS